MLRAAASLSLALLFGTALTAQPARAASSDTAAEKSPACEFGDELTRAFNDRDQAAAARLLNVEVLADRAARSFSDDPREQAGFTAGVNKAGARTLLAALFKALETGNGNVKCMRGLAPRRGRTLLRFDLGDSGFDYLEFVLQKDSSGELRVVDWFQLSRGELITVTVGALGRFMTDPNPGLLKTLFGVTTVDRAVVDQVKAIGSMQRAGKYAEAIAAIDKLPKQMAESRLLLSTRASNASLAKMEDEYKRTLATLAAKHGNDPAAAVMLLDHYFYEHQTARVMQAVGAIESRVGVDGLTTLLKANAWLDVGDYARTVTLAKEAVRLEPDRDSAYHSLAAGFIGLKNYAEAVKVYESLENGFGYAFERKHFTDATFAGFIKSAEFARWLPK